MNYTDQFPDIVTDEPNVYADPESQWVVDQQLKRGRNVGTLVTSLAAERDGADVRWYGTYTSIAEKDGRRILLRGHMCTDTVTGGLIVKDKLLTKQLLQRAGVSTPRGDLATSAADAVRLRHELGGSVVVKPRFGGQGKGVSVNLYTDDDVTDAFRLANKDGRGALVEEYIDGVEFRVIASPERCYGAIRRLLPHVRGDGKSTVRRLIDMKNDERRKNPNNCMLLIPVDHTTERYLRQQGLTLDSVLPSGRRITVRNVGGISSGGEASECLDLLDPEVLTVARNAIQAIPTMDWGGADILVEKTTGQAYLLELNTNAAISNSTYPVYGSPKDIGGPAWRRLYQRTPATEAMNPQIIPLEAPTDALSELFPKGVDDSISAMDARMLAFVQYLENQGWTTEQMSTRLLVAQDSSGNLKWFNGLMDDRFYASVSSLLRRHTVVQRILRDSGLTVPRSTTVQNLTEIRDYQARAKTELVAVPRNAGWYARQVLGSVVEQYPGAEGEKLTVQRAQTGQRLRVFASRRAPLAVFARDEISVPPNLWNRIGTTAIEAVQAIPSLPWAMADILVRDSAQQTVIVEGLSVRPDFREYTRLVAGSIDGMMGEIAGL